MPPVTAPYQATYAIADLPPGSTPTGAEQVEALQAGNSVRLSLAAILAALTPVPTIRLPLFASTISILVSDIEVGVSTATGAVTVNLPSAPLWAASPAGQTGLDLFIIDHTGNAAAHPITFALNGSDTFLQGALPSLAVNFGSIRLRPNGTVNSNTPIIGWIVKGFG
jgi:hypothetical protein